MVSHCNLKTSLQIIKSLTTLRGLIKRGRGFIHKKILKLHYSKKLNYFTFPVKFTKGILKVGCFYLNAIKPFPFFMINIFSTKKRQKRESIEEK